MMTMVAVMVVSGLKSIEHFYVVTAVYGFGTAVWAGWMAVCGLMGARKMKAACAEDWDAKLKDLQAKDPEAKNFMHILILPNYKEEEVLLKQTLGYLGRCCGAREYLHIVLAMEEREGDAAHKKADKLIAETKDLFAEVSACYHPAGLPNETPGKSSNESWGYQYAKRKYQKQIETFGASKIFLSIGDADTIWNTMHFSYMAYSALMMDEEQRNWTIWQPPVLLTRNLFNVPGPVRVSAYASFQFEIAGLANQSFGTHLAFSTYGLTLALAMHPEVNGWDVDVIAEDHHMFCKCYFASLWEQAAAKLNDQEEVALKPNLKLEPIWLPAAAFLAESPYGYVESLRERFVQAVRHSYGVIEMGYCCLQYIQLVRAVGVFNLPWSTHYGIFAIISKMHNVHIMNTVQALSLVLFILATVPKVAYWLLAGGFEIIINGGIMTYLWSPEGSSTFYVLLGCLGPVPVVMTLTNYTIFIVLLDLLEGRYGLPPPPRADEIVDLSAPPVEVKEKSLSYAERTRLCYAVHSDITVLAEPTIVIYGMIPELMACWSLFRREKFAYVLGAKPVAAS